MRGLQVLSFPCLVVCVCVCVCVGGGSALVTKDKGGIVSYKQPWDTDVAKRTLEQTGMYEASANLLWLNPFPLGNVAQQIAGDAPQWRTLLEAVDKFMTLEAAIESSLAPPQGACIPSSRTTPIN